MRVLGLCGSLRQRSLSAALLRGFRNLAPADIHVELFDLAGALPLFSPDAEIAPAPAAQALWAAVASADAMLVVSPEYAHGITAVMKNQLDWLVGQTSVVDLPVAVVNPACGSTHADAALREVLRTMSLSIDEAASVRIPVIGAGLDVEAIERGARFGDAIRGVLGALTVH
jgi:NAD(P)H-dependent FMN reductase